MNLTNQTQEPNSVSPQTEQTKLIDAAIEQIKRDLEAGDSTAIAELLTHVPQRNLQAFLPENGAMWDE